MNERNTLVYKNISLILFSKKRAHSLLSVEIQIERHIVRDRTSSSYIFFQEPGGANAYTPLQAVSSATP